MQVLDQLKSLAPIPHLENFETYLFIGPHPDDIEISSGATISRLVSLGKKIYFLVITDGGAGSMDHQMDINKLVSIRLEEMKSSAEVLGAKELFDLGFPDGGLYHEHEVAKRIASVILDINPDIVFCPDPYQPSEIHPDHIKAGLATNTAILMSAYPFMAKRNLIDFEKEALPHFHARTLAYYFTHRSNAYVSVSEADIVKRTQSIAKHVSQFSAPGSLEMVLQYLGVRSMIFEEKYQVKNAEGFFVLGPVHQHCFPEINEY